MRWAEREQEGRKGPGRWSRGLGFYPREVGVPRAVAEEGGV